jgi:hypothetical protein
MIILMRILPVALVMTLAACGGDKKSKGSKEGTTPEGLTGATQDVHEDRSRCEAEGHRVENTDLNDDGVIDVRNVYATVTKHGIEHEVLVCKETDLNFDGKKDIIRYFSDEGRPLRQEVDLDFDGGIDVITYFEDGKIVRSEYDTNFDGKVDMWNYYQQGKLLRSERDRNGDGKLDEWEHFDKEGNLLRIGYDTDGDGKVDHWERADTGEVVEEPEEEPAEESTEA